MTVYKWIFLLLLFPLLCPTLVLGQPAQARPQDPVDQFFFNPELIMQNQQKIALQPDQKENIIKLVEEGQRQFTRLQWDIQAEMEAMQAIIREPKVDDQAAIAQLDKVLEVERKIKRAQIVLLVRIKNQLTAEQQQVLMELKQRR